MLLKWIKLRKYSFPFALTAILGLTFILIIHVVIMCYITKLEQKLENYVYNGRV